MAEEGRTVLAGIRWLLGKNGPNSRPRPSKERGGITSSSSGQQKGRIKALLLCVSRDPRDKIPQLAVENQKKGRKNIQSKKEERWGRKFPKQPRMRPYCDRIEGRPRKGMEDLGGWKEGGIPKDS